MVKNYQPFALVENDDFIEYSNTLNSKAKVPGKHAIRVSIHEKFLDFKKKLIAKIHDQKVTLSFT